jgi:hypothetical protein
MIRLVAIFGLVAGGIVALGQLTAAQWHAAGLNVLAEVTTHGTLALPWLLTLGFALAWLRQRDITRAFRDGYLDAIARPRRPRGRR